MSENVGKELTHQLIRVGKLSSSVPLNRLRKDKRSIPKFRFHSYSKLGTNLKERQSHINFGFSN